MASNPAPELAVLIPFYGQVPALQETLSSLSQDTFPHDVIVVDDGNIPALEIPQERHPRVIVVKHDRNRGITEALNTGLAYALKCGYQYIARLDAGDRNIPGRLGKQVSFLERLPQCQLVGAQARFVDEEGHFLYTSEMPTEHAVIYRRLHRQSCFIHPTIMFRASVLTKVGGYRDKYPAAEDYDLFFRIAGQFPTANLEDILITYQVSAKSISSRRRRRQLFSRLRIVLEHFDARMLDSYRGLLESMIAILVPRFLISHLHTLAHRLKYAWRGLPNEH